MAGMLTQSLNAAIDTLCKTKKTNRAALAAKAKLPRSAFTRIRKGEDVTLETLRKLRKCGVKHPLVAAA